MEITDTKYYVYFTYNKERQVQGFEKQGKDVSPLVPLVVDEQKLRKLVRLAQSEAQSYVLEKLRDIGIFKTNPMIQEPPEWLGLVDYAQSAIDNMYKRIR